MSFLVALVIPLRFLRWYGEGREEASVGDVDIGEKREEEEEEEEMEVYGNISDAAGFVPGTIVFEVKKFILGGEILSREECMVEGGGGGGGGKSSSPR